MVFAGKVVLVTGSTTGIGEACAHVFAESGAKVMVSGRHEPRGRAVVEPVIRTTFPANIIVLLSHAEPAPDKYKQWRAQRA